VRRVLAARVGQQVGVGVRWGLAGRRRARCGGWRMCPASQSEARSSEVTPPAQRSVVPDFVPNRAVEMPAYAALSATVPPLKASHEQACRAVEPALMPIFPGKRRNVLYRPRKKKAPQKEGAASAPPNAA